MPPPLPPPPAEDCSKICLYLTLPPTVSYSHLLHPYTGLFQDYETFFGQVEDVHPYATGSQFANYKNEFYASMAHPTDIKVGEVTNATSHTATSSLMADTVIPVGETAKYHHLVGDGDEFSSGSVGTVPPAPPAVGGYSYSYASYGDDDKYLDWLSTMVVVTPYFGDMADRVAQAATDNLVGYSKCKVLGPCGGTQVEGSPCSATDGNAGYCFADAEGDLLCGTTAQWWSFGTQYSSEGMIKANEVQATPLPCARNAIATTDLSGAWQPRLLVGGCMISSDPYYSSWVEVHLPNACATPTDLATSLQGCMDKGATNYVPGARQPTKCLYSLSGCMNSLALNYNSEASDDDGSCIVETCGCGISGGATPYYGVPTDTPKYQSLTVGVPISPLTASSFSVGSGMNALPSYGAVTNYVAGATVLGGPMCSGFPTIGSACTMVIEGCMSPTAINYDAAANVQTNTWCVEPVTGCMMPGVTEPSSGFITSKYIGRYGFSSNYNSAATVNSPSGCVVEVYGCTDPTAYNYDPHATVDFKCFGTVVGCLNPEALNFNCSASGSSNCSDSVTYHNKDVCTFYVPTVDSEGAGADTLELTLTSSGDVSSVTSAMTTAVSAYFAARAGVAASDVVTTVAAGSIVWTVTFSNLTPTQYEDFKVYEEMALTDTDGATAALDSALTAAGVAPGTFTVTAVTVTETENRAYPPPSAPPSDEIGIIVGVVVGVVVIIVIIAVFVMMRKKKGGVAPQ